MPRKKKDNEFSMVNGIRKTKDGRYEAAVYVGLSNELGKNGKPKKLYDWIREDTHAECKKAKLELEQSISDGTYSKVAKMLFSDYADKWIGMLDSSKADSTIKSYKMYIEKHFKPALGRYKVGDISEFNIKEFINAKFKDKLSSSTVRRQFLILNKMMQDAMKYKNPCKDIKAPEKAKYTPKVPTEDEYKLLLNAVSGMFDELPILLAGWCGMREGEIFCLKWNDIDFELGTIRVDEAMAISEEGYKDKDPKSDNGNRTIVAPEYVLKLLKVIKPSDDEKVIDIKAGEEKIFDMRPDSYSERFSNIIDYHNELFDIRKRYGQIALDNSLKYHKNNSIKKNLNIQNKKLPDVTFHALRHYHATVLYNNNIDDLYAASRLGHDIRVLKGIYQHLQLNTLKKNDVKIKEIFK